MSDDQTGAASEGAEPDHRPRLQSKAFDCPRCGAYAYQEWDQLQRRVNPSQFTSLERSAVWSTSRCSRCDDVSIWRGEQLVYPLKSVGGKPHKDMPDHVKKLYEEAATVAAVSPRAGAALARATVEQLIKHLDIDVKPGESLNARIERLEGKVSSDLRTMLHIVRETGNQALHEKDQLGELAVVVLDDTEGPQLLEYLLRTANDLAEELITRPATTEAFRAKLPEWVRKKLGDTGTAAAEDAS